jgi:hypothetical protein
MFRWAVDFINALLDDTAPLANGCPVDVEADRRLAKAAAEAVRHDSRSYHHARNRLQRATTEALRAEVGR